MVSIQRLTIFQMNDTHGYVEPHRELVWDGSEPTYPVLGGFARIKTLLDDARRENPGGVLALDNGDTFHGTYPAVSTKGLALVPLVNALGLDAMTAHWEFAWGPRHFLDLAERLGHPVLAANCFAKDSGERPFPGTMVVERAGLRVGVVGLAATIVDKSMPPHFSTGLRFTDGVTEADEAVERLRREDRVDVVVLLSHLGFPQDIELAGLVRGIDVIVSGHTHNRLERPAYVGKTIVIQSGCHGSFVGLLDLDVEGGRILAHRHRLVAVDDGIRRALVMRDHLRQEIVLGITRHRGRHHAGVHRVHRLGGGSGIRRGIARRRRHGDRRMPMGRRLLRHDGHHDRGNTGKGHEKRLVHWLKVPRTMDRGVDAGRSGLFLRPHHFFGIGRFAGSPSGGFGQP